MKPELDLKAWIREHKVCWELVPYYAVGGDGRIQVGFELDLYAQHLPGSKPNPGCRECADVFETLRQIAVSVLPKEVRPTRYDIQPFDASFHLRPETKMKAEVQLTMLIVHREDFFNGVDDCERRCAKEIQQNLKALGVQSKVWSARLSKQHEHDKSGDS